MALLFSRVLRRCAKNNLYTATRFSSKGKDKKIKY